MDRQTADEIIIEYLPKIYGFSIKKSFGYSEAEEVCSDIAAELYNSLLKSEKIYNLDGYIRRVSEHVYSKYIFSKKKHQDISIDSMEIPYEENFVEDNVNDKMMLLRREIAFLTKIRRSIIYSFYYENKPIFQIAKELGIPEGTVKWHLNKARNQMKEGFTMERKIGKLGITPIAACGFGHSGTPGQNGGPEYYLNDKLNLNIVYSVYFSPKTREEIAEELGVTPVFIEDKIDYLEGNGFLAKRSGNKYTTYVKFDPEKYSLEQEENALKKELEIAEILVKDYVPKVYDAMKDFNNIYIPSGNRELLIAAAIMYGVANKCRLPIKKDLTKYYIQTVDGGNFIATVNLSSVQSDTDYKATLHLPTYYACGNMYRQSSKYPSVYSWSIDSRYSSRQGAWQNNLTSDYEYVYEFIKGTIQDNLADREKLDRLRQRQYITDDSRINIMIAKYKSEDFFTKIPEISKSIQRKFADYALETASMIAREYPSQMRDLVISWTAGGFISNRTALMVMDILYDNGTFRKLTEQEKITSNLIMFCDTLPKSRQQ